MKASVLLRYCYLDLFADGVRLVPILQIFFLATCATVYLFSKGLPEHQKYLRIQELENNPGARSLHILGNSGIRTGRMSPIDYSSLESKVKSEIGYAIQDIFPDHGKVNMKLKSHGSRDFKPVIGKVLNDRDLSLVGQKIVGGTTFSHDLFMKNSADSSNEPSIRIILGMRFKSAYPNEDCSSFTGKFDGLDGVIPRIVPVCELANDQIDESDFYVFKSDLDRAFAIASEESKKSHAVHVRLSPVLLRNQFFKEWCSLSDLRTPYDIGKSDDMVLARLIHLPGPGSQSKFGWDLLLDTARKHKDFPPKAVIEIVELFNPETASKSDTYMPESINGMYIFVNDVQSLSLVKSVFINWLDEVTQKLGDKPNIGATTAFIENPVTLRLVEEIDKGASQSRQLVSVFIFSLDLLVVISFLITGFVRVQVTKSVLGLLRMMGASQWDLIVITFCQNLILGLFGLASGYVLGYLILTGYFSLRGVPLVVFWNSYFIFTSLYSFFIGLISMACAASLSAFWISFESPAQLINSH